MSKIFISYRRDDSGYVADWIFKRLCQDFDASAIFFDVDGMPLGVEWDAYLRERVQECNLMLVVIGKHWLDMRDPKNGERRLDQAIDFVRYEIETALARGIPIIPLFLDGLTGLPEDRLPASIQRLAKRQGLTVRRLPDFEGDMTRLIGSMKRLLITASPSPAPAAPATPTTPATVRQTPPPPPAEPAAGTRRVDDFGVPMVYVPAGKFLMGSTPQQVEDAFQERKKKDKDAQKAWYEDQLPQHEQTIARGFWLDLTPVTNEAYARFVAAGGYQNRAYWTEAGWGWIQKDKITGPVDYENFTSPQQPRVGVTWVEAWAYAQWRGGRLPTEAEWEWAARGPENRIYPWGNTFDASGLIYRDNSGGTTAAVGEGIRKAGASWAGVLDMSGNVWEWCSSLYQPYPYRADDGREDGLDGSNRRVLRGGSWYIDRVLARAAFRYYFHPGYRLNNFGFRLVCLPPSQGH
jgi:formylglycine-generating enzyme required for sulfatase activity